MKVLCVGLMVCDVLVKPIASNIFCKDHVLVEDIELSVGGDAFNVASNLTALGTSSCLCSAVGKDRIGEFILKYVSEIGLNECHLLTSDKSTAATVVMICEDGERHFAAKQGASQFITNEDIPERLLKENDIMYIGSACGLPGLDGDGMLRLAQRAKAHDMLVAMDVTGAILPMHVQQVSRSLPYVDFFMPSNYEAQLLSGQEDLVKSAQIFMTYGAKHVIIKLGSEGAMYVEPDGGVRRFPARKVALVDSTGAGDAFVAGFLASIARGYSIPEGIKIATLTGAECIQSIGASGKLRDFNSYMKAEE